MVVKSWPIFVNRFEPENKHNKSEETHKLRPLMETNIK